MLLLVFSFSLAVSAVAQVGAGAARTSSGNPAAQPAPAPSKPEDLCTIEGVVRDSVSDGPLQKAQLLLMRVGSQERPYSSSSDTNGKFVMKSIEPGQYRLSTVRNGFVRSEYGATGIGRVGTTLTLEKGQAIRNFEIKLAPHAVITGRVVDSDGEPVPYSQVSTLRPVFIQGRRQMMPSGMAMTNDLGEYRIFGLPPGKYLLAASSRNDQFSVSNAIDASGREVVDVNATTYYPGVVEPTQAVRVQVAPGARVDAVDIRLARTRAYRVRGRVTGIPGRGRQVSVALNDRGDNPFAMMGAGRGFSQVMPDGQFEIRGVRPGDYYLQATYFDQDLRLSGRLAVNVTDSNLEGLSVALEPGFELKGSVRVEGAESKAKLEEVWFALESRDRSENMFGSPNTRANEDGTFSLRQMRHSKYDMRIFRLPEGYYLKSARLEETDILADDAEIRPGGQLELILSPDAGKIEGSVTNDKGDPAPGVAVVAVPADKRVRVSQTAPVTTDQAGRYMIKNLPPGDYSLVAIEGYEYGMDQDPDFLKTYQSVSQKVAIRAKSVETKSLRSAPAAEI